jgi:predicted DNA binding CopG/RHH family protein
VNTRPTTISLRLPLALLGDIKVAANKQDVPYQLLIRVWLWERAEAEKLKVLQTGEVDGKPIGGTRNS